jgi:hypothetical protein
MCVANTAYYGGADPLGAAGDFITAPEISQMFGEMVGIWLSDIWLRQGSPFGCYYVELGPGRGTLAADALRTMKRFDGSLLSTFWKTARRCAPSNPKPCRMQPSTTIWTACRPMHLCSLWQTSFLTHCLFGS